MNQIKIITTGGGWIGEGRRSFYGLISELINKALTKITFTIFIITQSSIVDQIEIALKRGISIEIYIYTKQSLNERMLKKLMILESRYENLKVHQIKNKVLHAKLMIVDNSKVLIGSANLSFKGLEENYELGLYVDDIKIAQELLIILKKLI